MSDSPTRQGPYHLTVWGGPNLARAVELTRLRFGVAPPMTVVATDKEALAAAKTPWGRLGPGPGGGQRLVGPPAGRAASEDLRRPALPGALGPAGRLRGGRGRGRAHWRRPDLLGHRQPQGAAAVIDALSTDGVAAELVAEAGGLKLFSLLGFYQAGDERLARAPGSLRASSGLRPLPSTCKKTASPFPEFLDDRSDHRPLRRAPSHASRASAIRN